MATFSESDEPNLDLLHCKEQFCEAKVFEHGYIRLCENGHRWIENNEAEQ